MNGFVGHPGELWNGSVNTISPNHKQYIKTTDFERPDEIFVTLDENPDSVNDGFFWNPPENNSTWSDLPASYHNGAAGFSFADGHAEIKRWTSGLTRRGVTTVGWFPGLVIDDGNTSDYDWVAKRSTVLR